MPADPALDARVASLVAALSPEEKLALLPTRQGAVPRLGLPEFWIGGEAAHGLVARDGTTTVFPQTLGLASTWDRDLLGRLGAVVADEARAFSARRGGLSGLCLWAPTVDLERDPRWGRTEEGYGEDPYLTGELASAYIRGLQGEDPQALKTVATVKHFFGNNHETDRTRSSSRIPDDLIRSYYLEPFRRCLVGGGALSLMTAYNAVNGVPAMLRPEVNQVVRGEWGWDGFVVCDGGALALLVSDHRAFATWAEALAASLKAGIDCFPEPAEALISAGVEALQQGLITEADLDRAITRTLKARLRLSPQPAPWAAVYGAARGPLAREAATKAAVLLENDGTLPFHEASVKTLAVVGPLADAAYRDWYSGTPAGAVTPLRGLVERLGADRVWAADGCDLVALRAPDGRYVGVAAWDDPGLVADRPSVQPGELYRRTDWGWGTQTFQALSNGRFLTADSDEVTASAAEVGGWFVREKFGAPREGRGVLSTWKGDPVGLDARGRLAVAGPQGPAACEFAVEVVHSGLRGAQGAARAADAAVVFVGSHPLLNGRETQDRPSLELPPEQVDLIRAVARVNPRTVVVIIGSYPYTIGSWKDEVSAVLWTVHGGQEAGHALTDLLWGEANPGGRLTMTWYRSEADLGPLDDYDIRSQGLTHLYHQGPVLYPFGYGLSYSNFAYRHLLVDPEAGRAVVTLTNQGPRAGDEVVQAYLGRELVAFARTRLEPGETRTVELVLDRVPLAHETLSVGSSSLDLRLHQPPQGSL